MPVPLDEYPIHQVPLSLAYVGTSDEILRAGRLCDVSEEIQRVRAEARKKHGWLMDIYLLRRRA